MQPVDIQAETSCFIDQSLLKNANKFNAASKKLNCLQLMVLRLNIGLFLSPHWPFTSMYPCLMSLVNKTNTTNGSWEASGPKNVYLCLQMSSSLHADISY